jgi:multicomponent Na+:H+ antiporter subunit E
VTLLIWNVALALIWAAGTGTLTLLNLGFGFLLGYAVLWLLRDVVGPTPYFGRWARALGFAGFFLRELIVANFRVAYEVITPRHRMRPGVIAIPLDVTTDAEITVLANVISLTPGTLSLDVSRDRRILYLHAMYIDDRAALERELKEGFERRLLELFEGAARPRRPGDAVAGTGTDAAAGPRAGGA